MCWSPFLCSPVYTLDSCCSRTGWRWADSTSDSFSFCLFVELCLDITTLTSIFTLIYQFSPDHILSLAAISPISFIDFFFYPFWLCFLFPLLPYKNSSSVWREKALSLPFGKAVAKFCLFDFSLDVRLWYGEGSGHTSQQLLFPSPPPP